MATFTTSNNNTYEFSFERQSDGSVRIYIDDQPSYTWWDGGRDTDPHKTHRNKDGNRYYVCVTEESQPRTVNEAKVVAEEWVKRTDRYLRSGVPFESPGSPPARAMSV